MYANIIWTKNFKIKDMYYSLKNNNLEKLNT